MKAKIIITSEDLSPIQKDHIIEDLINDIDGIKKAKFRKNKLIVKYRKTELDADEIIEFLESIGYVGELLDDN